MTNPYCGALGIAVPSLEELRDHREARPYSLLIVALLEQGGPLTLAQVAERFAAAGVAPVDRALLSLKRCKPARAPIYRDGDQYALDPYDDELDLWVFRLGLRPPRGPSLRIVRPAPEPSPGPEEPLSVAELDEAWRDASLSGWSAQRLALAVLDAHGEALEPEEVVRFVAARTRYHVLRPEVARYWRRGSPVRVREDGRWEIGPEREPLLAARKAVRERVGMARRLAERWGDPAVVKANMRAAERRSAANAEKLASLRRVLVHVFPPPTARKRQHGKAAPGPAAVVLLDVAERRIETFFAEDLDTARKRIAVYDLVAAVEVRATLRALQVDPGARRLAELGPPQKTMKLNRRGRTLKITNELLIRGSCNIARPLGDRKKLAIYLRDGQTTRLRRRLEADAKSLFALYQYGRLHGCVRLQWGFLDEMIPVPWVHRDEPRLYGLKRRAHEQGRILEVVTGTAPGWAEPWSRARRCAVAPDGSGWGHVLVDEEGFVVDDWEVQAARVIPGRS